MTSARWTEEQDALLRKMWEDHPTVEIALALGAGKTRNAVIGRAHRLGLRTKSPRPFALPRRAKTRLWTCGNCGMGLNAGSRCSGCGSLPAA